MKNKFLTIVLFCFTNLFGQENYYNDLYIIIKNKSDLSPQIERNDTIKNEYYNLSWPKKYGYKKLWIKYDELNGVSKGTKFIESNSFNNLTVNYKNINNNNPIKVIPKNNTYIKPLKTYINGFFKNNNVILFQEFLWYDNHELFEVIKKVKNLYIVFEEEEINDFYFAKKVTILPSSQL